VGGPIPIPCYRTLITHRYLAIAALVALLVGGSILSAWAADDAPPTASPPATLLAHSIFFSLKEPSDENIAKLVEACKNHLSQHPGIVFFAVGTRDEKINGGFNDKAYDVALHMVFTGREALGAYARTPGHQKFVAESATMLKGLRIFDSTVESVPNKSESAK
jgi:hypothetical protein